MIRRTALTSAVAIAAVVVTGTIALGANLGLLTTQDALAAPAAAIDEVAASETIDLFLPVAAESDSVSGVADDAPLTEQEFTIDRAGTLVVLFNADGLQIDSVSPADGWEWETTESSDGEVHVAFTNGQAAIEFVATVNEDGSLSATVDELITEYVQDPSVIVEVEVAAPAPVAPNQISSAAASALLAAAQPVASSTQAATTADPAPAAVATDEAASASREYEDHEDYEDHDEYEEDEYEDEDHDEYEDHDEEEHEEEHEDEHEDEREEEDEDREDEEDA